MKIGRYSLSGTSLVLLVVQLAFVSLIAANYLYQRLTLPRVWAQTIVIDPNMVMRGRYLSLQLQVDGCQSTLNSAKQAIFPRDINNAATPGPYSIQHNQSVQFPADLKVQNNQLVAIRVQNPDTADPGQTVSAFPGSPCQSMRLDQPVDFFIAEHASSPLPLKPGQELWIEVTVPPNGPPRPLQLALKQNSIWKPLAFE